MLERYGLIGKKVEKGSEVILAYRFVNLKTRAIVEVESDKLYDFMSTHKITNVRLNPYSKSFEMIYQHLNHIPVYRNDGSVSSYYFKVILDNPSSNTYTFANITGSIVTCNLPKFFFKFFDLLSDKGVIVVTPNRCNKFTNNLDGSFKSEEIDSKLVTNLSPYKMYDSSNVRISYSTNECDYLGSTYYCFSLSDLDYNHGLFLSASKLNGHFTGIYERSDKGYTLKSISVRTDTMGIKYDLNHFDLVRYNVLKYDKNYYFVGLDGLTCFGESFMELHNEYLDEYYNRLLAVSPDDAELFKDAVKVGGCGDLVYCNLALVNIPDGLTSVSNNALCFDLTNHVELYDKYVYEKLKPEDVIIPESVQKFSNNAFSNYIINSFTYNISDVLTSQSNLHVLNPAIATNVFNSLLHAGIRFKSVIVNGDLNLTYSLVKRLYEYEKHSSVMSSNFKLLTCSMKKGLTFKPVKKLDSFHLDTCDILPYMYTAMDLKEFRMLFFNTYDEFASVFTSKVEEAWGEYEELKAGYKEFKDRDSFLEYESKVHNFFTNYSILRNMILGSCIINGDVNSYMTLCRKVESRYNNVASLLKEKLCLIRLKNSKVWNL